MDWTSWSTSETEAYKVEEECPKKRYVRYDIIIGRDELGKVYKGFDKKDGIEIGWCKINLKGRGVPKLALTNQKIHASYKLQMLDHENLVKCYHSWGNESRDFFNIITDTFTPGNLRDYINKHPQIDENSIKNWCRQILKALHYLHTQNPPLIHHDVKIENIFIDGESGKVKLGYFGYAFPFIRGGMLTVYPFTSVTMAPDIFGEEYDEKIDIYSFGMTVLQMVSRENVYSECNNDKERIYKKIKSGVPPNALIRMRDTRIWGLFLKCLFENRSRRASAIDLLNDEPFLREYVFETTAAAAESRSELDRILTLRSFAKAVAAKLQDAAEREKTSLSETLTGETLNAAASTRTEKEEEEGKDEDEDEEEASLIHRRSSRPTHHQQQSESHQEEFDSEQGGETFESESKEQEKDEVESERGGDTFGSENKEPEKEEGTSSPTNGTNEEDQV